MLPGGTSAASEGELMLADFRRLLSHSVPLSVFLAAADCQVLPESCIDDFSKTVCQFQGQLKRRAYCHFSGETVNKAVM